MCLILGGGGEGGLTCETGRAMIRTGMQNGLKTYAKLTRELTNNVNFIRHKFYVEFEILSDVSIFHSSKCQNFAFC